MNRKTLEELYVNTMRMHNLLQRARAKARLNRFGHVSKQTVEDYYTPQIEIALTFVKEYEKLLTTIEP